MTVIERPSAVPEEPPAEQALEQEGVLHPRRWTRAEYYRLGEVGFFEDERVELLDGEIWTLPLQKTPHFSATRRAADALEDAFGDGFGIRPQALMTLDDGTEPEPDVLVVPGSRLDYEDHHPIPSEVSLLVEVSDSTLAKDRGRKVEDYARVGTPDYWIVNLVDRPLEVHRDPGALPNGHGYKLRRVLLEGEAAAPLLAPGRPIPVTDLLPQQILPQP